jgi:hypothetical protein
MAKCRFSAVRVAAALPVLLAGFAGSAFAATEIKGAAILDHPCGKVAVKQSGLLQAGKFEEANKLSTKDMQDDYKKMPAKDREMMNGMAKMMSPTEDKFAAMIKASGVLVIDGQTATLTTKTTTKDKSGTSTESTTQKFKIDGAVCLVSR